MKNRIKWYTVIVMLAIICVYCTEHDDYRKFMPDGENIYLQKPDSLKAFSGKNRILLEWVTIDPRVSSAKIYYEQSGIHRDTTVLIETPQVRNNDTIRVIMANLEEAIHTFRIVAHDDFGNESIEVETSEMSYGQAYERTRINRIVRQAAYTLDDVLTIDWYDGETTEIGVNLFYTDRDGNEKERFVPRTELFTEVDDFDFDEPLFFNTMYKPVPTTIDTFYSQTAQQTVRKLDARNITADVLTNHQQRFLIGADVSHNGRYFEAAGWTYTVSDNVRQNGNVDGWLNNTLLIIASTHDGWHGQSVTNGKLFQTVELNAGTYIFTALVIETNYPNNPDIAQAHIVVALGDDLPDTNNVPDQALAYVTPPPFVIVRDGPDELFSIEFVLTQRSTVSLGFVATFTPPAAADIHQMHIRQVELWQK